MFNGICLDRGMRPQQMIFEMPQPLSRLDHRTECHRRRRFLSPFDAVVFRLNICSMSLINPVYPSAPNALASL
jgi:hypothetical protein